MTQPVFGATPFAESATPNPQDAFDLITGEQLATLQSQYPERSFLVDENVQAVCERIHGSKGTHASKDAMEDAYAGKWLVVAFNVGDHRSRFGMEIVTAQHPAEKAGLVPGQVPVPQRYGLTAIFDAEPWWEQVGALVIGQRVTVLGQIDQLNQADIRLRNCELV